MSDATLPNARGALLAAASLLALHLALGSAVAGAPTVIDRVVFDAAPAVRSSLLGPLLEVFDRLGQGVVWAGALFWLCLGFVLARRPNIALLIAAGWLSELVVFASKLTVGRVGPFPLSLTVDAETASYPSGHVTRVLVAAGSSFSSRFRLANMGAGRSLPRCW